MWGDNFEGGTSFHVYDIIKKLSGKYNFYVLAPYNYLYRLFIYLDEKIDSVELFTTSLFGNKGRYFNTEYSVLLNDIIEYFRIDIIHVHHMLGHYFDIINILKDKNIKLMISLHDFYSICPRINKYDNNNKYCGNPSENECSDCLLAYTNKDYGIEEERNIHEWRKIWALLFSLAYKIIVPSENTKREISTIYKQLPIDVIEHGIDIEHKKEILNIDKDDEYDVAFIGNITEIKGLLKIEKLIKYSRKFKNNIFFHLFGTVFSNHLVFGSMYVKYLKKDKKNYCYHGKYERENLSRLLTECKIKLVCIFSIIPETYNYVLSESIANNIPLLVIDEGAVGQKVRENKLGWLIMNETGIPDIYKTIISIFNDKGIYKEISKSISEYKIKNINEMIRDYDKHYSCFKVGDLRNNIVAYAYNNFLNKYYLSKIICNYFLNEIEKLKDSSSWLIGNIIAWMPRKMKKIIKNYIDYGFINTTKKIVRKFVDLFYI